MVPPRKCALCAASESNRKHRDGTGSVFTQEEVLGGDIVRLLWAAATVTLTPEMRHGCTRAAMNR